MSVEVRERFAVARGVSAIARGTPWTWPSNAVEICGHCRDAPPKRQKMYILHNTAVSDSSHTMVAQPLLVLDSQNALVDGIAS